MENKSNVISCKYSKDQILKSSQFTNTEKCLLSVILEEKKYTIDEAKTMVEKEKNRGVK